MSLNYYSRLRIIIRQLPCVGEIWHREMGLKKGKEDCSGKRHSTSVLLGFGVFLWQHSSSTIEKLSEKENDLSSVGELRWCLCFDCFPAEMPNRQIKEESGREDGGCCWWRWWWYLEIWNGASVSYCTIPPFPHLAGVHPQSAALSGTVVSQRCVGRSKHFPGLLFLQLFFFFYTICGFTVTTLNLKKAQHNFYPDTQWVS